MDSLALIIKQAIENIDTRKLIFKSNFKDRFTHALVEKLNCNSPYFCIEQYPIRLTGKTKDSKIDIVGFCKEGKYWENTLFEIELVDSRKDWGLEAKLYSPHQSISSDENYEKMSFDGPRTDFDKLKIDFKHFIILMLQVEVENYDEIDEDDFSKLKESYNYFKTYITHDFGKAKKHLKKTENRVTSLLEKAANQTFRDLADENGFLYTNEQGSITKKLIEKGGNCPLKIHFMINEFEKP